MGKLTPEGVVKLEICKYLETIPDLEFWVTYNGAIYNPTRKIFMRPNSRYYRKGLSDICGLWDGTAIFIETKSKNGRATPEQKAFISRMEELGAIAFFARSVDDVRAHISVRSGGGVML